MLKHFITFLPLVCVVALGCHEQDESPRDAAPSPSPVSQPRMEPTSAASQSDLNALMAREGSVTFRSWNGKLQGSDNDTDLTFLPGGVVHMIEYGDAISSYDGIYAIADNGKVTLQFPKFGQPWPAMNLRKDSRSLLLVPNDPGAGILIDNRGGATFGHGRGKYWPFRALTSDAHAHPGSQPPSSQHANGKARAVYDQVLQCIEWGEIRPLSPGGETMALQPSQIKMVTTHPRIALDILENKLRSNETAQRLNAYDFLVELVPTPMGDRALALLRRGPNDVNLNVREQTSRALAVIDRAKSTAPATRD